MTNSPSLYRAVHILSGTGCDRFGPLLAAVAAQHLPAIAKRGRSALALEGRNRETAKLTVENLVLFARRLTQPSDRLFVETPRHTKQVEPKWCLYAGLQVADHALGGPSLAYRSGICSTLTFAARRDHVDEAEFHSRAHGLFDGLAADIAYLEDETPWAHEIAPLPGAVVRGWFMSLRADDLTGTYCGEKLRPPSVVQPPGGVSGQPIIDGVIIAAHHCGRLPRAIQRDRPDPATGACLLTKDDMTPEALDALRTPWHPQDRLP